MARVQRYISKELTHFVGASLSSEEDQYQLLVKILKGGRLTSSPNIPWPIGGLVVAVRRRISTNDMYSPQSVCFCDIPPDDLEVHVAKYSRFGLAFEKATLAALGASPVFYMASTALIPDIKFPEHWTDCANKQHDADAYGPEMPEDKTTQAELFDIALPAWHEFLRSRSPQPTTDPQLGLEDRFLFLAGRVFDYRIFGYIKFFDPACDDSDKENYYMEREWRVIGQVDFSLAEVVRVLLPREFGQRFRDDVPRYGGQVQFIPPRAAESRT